MKHKVSITFFLLIIVTVILLNKTAPGNKFSSKLSSLAGLFYATTSTSEQLRSDYSNRKIRVLLVPGHTNEVWGTQYQGVKEADLNLAITKDIRLMFDYDDRFEVSVTRGVDGNYEPWFTQYVKDNEAEILDWKQKQKSEFNTAVSEGFINREVNVVHNEVSADIARDLYAINKYSGENPIDLVLHIHFNDHPGRKKNEEGKYTGFAFYVPDQQFPNASSSVAVAETIRARLATYFASSNFPSESSVIIPDQDLIAVGANGSQKKAAILIEYGYIYEEQYIDPPVRDPLLMEMARLTYKGISDFFNDGQDLSQSEKDFDTLLPYTWIRPIEPSMKRTRDTLSLQAALHKDGVYPPVGMTLNDCPLSGRYGACTRQAVKAFQEKFAENILTPAGLEEGTGIAGGRTINHLNKLYGSKLQESI